MNAYRKVRSLAWRASMAGLPRGAHLTRYFMYERLRSLGAGTLSNEVGRTLAVSRSQGLLDAMGIRPREVVAADYPEHNLLALRFPDDSFDYVVSDQVLEHIEGAPQRAIDECRRVLRPGGIAIHTTCFVNPIHEAPHDYWRFTPAALSLLHREWSAILEVGGWGNRAAWSAVDDGLRHVPVPHARWHPLHRIATRNDPAWPIVTWIVARK